MRPVSSRIENEVGGGDDRHVAAAPPEQRLGSDDPVGREVDLGLVVEEELRPLQGPPEARLQLHPLARPGVHVGAVERVAVPSLALHPVHRGVAHCRSVATSSPSSGKG